MKIWHYTPATYIYVTGEKMMCFAYARGQKPTKLDYNLISTLPENSIKRWLNRLPITWKFIDAEHQQQTAIMKNWITENVKLKQVNIKFDSSGWPHTLSIGNLTKAISEFPYILKKIKHTDELLVDLKTAFDNTERETLLEYGFNDNHFPWRYNTHKKEYINLSRTMDDVLKQIPNIPKTSFNVWETILR
jgi:hypothetical protein